MVKKNKILLFKKLAGIITIFFLLAIVFPAQAFYLEVPKDFKKDWQDVIASKVKGIEETAGNTSLENSSNQPGQTCRVNGIEMPGPCENYNTPNPEQMQPLAPKSSSGPGAGQQGPSEDQIRQQNERQLKDIKRGAKQMEINLKRLESEFKKAKGKGTEIPQETQGNLNKARTMVDSIKSAQTVEEMQGVDLNDLQEIIQSLDESRQEVIEKAQRVDSVKRGIRGMESGLKMFENQITKLTKQKIVIPEEISENLKKVKTIVNVVKNAKTWQEMEDAGVEDLQEAMSSLDQNRDQLEMLARWPQTLKQMNQELNKLSADLKRSKTIVDRLKKQDIDLNETYSNFEAGINKLKTVRDEVTGKMKTSNSVEAFDILENDFFGQLDDIRQNQNIIQTMSNLGRFVSDFKNGLAQAQAQIRKLKGKKIDTGELAVILNNTKIKGEEIVKMIKAKPVDEETISYSLQEMEILRQDFEEKVMELTGEEQSMPWQQGTKQFESPQMPFNWNQIMPKKSEGPVQSSCPPCPNVCESSSGQIIQ